MVPYVAGRGHSFKGAGLYYLHDKDALTSDRVAWTHTHNLPTDNPEKALRWMAFTAKSADRLKEQAGTVRTGRKSTAGQVYAFSLSWHPEEKPEKEHMMSAAFETLKRLGLNEHEAVFVAHQETEHPHVHIICNLVSPKDGRTAAPAYDRLTLSTWAQEHETATGKIYCEKRVENNEKRREKVKPDRQLALVKGKEEKHLSAEQIQDIYTRSDSGRAFQSALEEAGFTLAKGDRRGFVLVDSQGKIHSLSRQLQGQRASDLKARLSDIDERSLPEASTIADERRYFDRDRYEADFQKSIVDSAIEEAEQNKAEAPQIKREEKPADTRQADPAPYDTGSHLAELDKRRKWEQDVQRRRDQLEKQVSEFYGRDKTAARLEALQKEAERNATLWGRMSGKAQELQDEMEGLMQTLASIDMRIEEQRQALNADIERSREETFSAAEKAKQLEIEQKRQRQIDALKAQMNSKFNRSDRDQDHELDLGR